MLIVSPWVVILFESQGFEADFVPKRKTPGEFRNLFGFHLAHVAQLVEHVLGKDEVTGSIPVMGSSRAQRKFATTNQTTKHYG